MSKFNSGAVRSTQESQPLFGNKSIKDSIMDNLDADIAQTTVADAVSEAAPASGELVGGVDVSQDMAPAAPQSYEDEGAFEEELGLNPDGSPRKLGARMNQAVAGELNPQMTTTTEATNVKRPSLLGSGKMSAPEPFKFPTYESTPTRDSISNMTGRAKTFAQGLKDRTLQGNWHFGGQDTQTMAEYRRTGEKTDAVKDALERKAEKNTLAETITTKIPNAVDVSPADDRYSINPEFGMLMGVITENHIGDAVLAAPDSSMVDAEIEEITGIKENPDKPKEINPVEGAAKLGREIIKWHDVSLAEKGQQPTPKMSDREYKDLGAMALQAYQLSNPDMVAVTKDPDTGGIRYSLTPEGEAEMNRSESVRKSMFNVMIPPLHARPLKGKLVDSLQKFKPQFRKRGMMGEVSVIEESMDNQSSVNHIVDQRRTRILFAMIVPTMFRRPGDQKDRFGNIFGVGETALRQTYTKATRIDGMPEPDANKEAIRVVNANKANLMKEINALVRNYLKPNYLTYAVQVLTGRTHAQQTDFNPTRNKLVRFATRGQTPTRITKGSRTERNFFSALALNLLNPKQDGKGMNDLLLEPARQNAARSLVDKWYAMGKEVKALLDEAVPAEVFEQMTDAVNAGMKIDDPAFPKPPMQVFGENMSPALTQLLKDKSEDAPMALESLLELVDYVDNMEAKGEHYSNLNAYVDGKTNGIALSAAILGNEALAYRTGVLRPDDAVYAVQDPQGNAWDARDAMEDSILTRLTAMEASTLNKLDEPTFNWNTVGMKGTESDEVKMHMLTVMKTMASYRGLNKNISMVFPYGKELAGMKTEVLNHFMDVLGDVNSKKFQEAVEALESMGIKQDQMIKAVHANVVDSLFDVFGRDTFEGRQMMRSASFLMGVMDYNLVIEGADGMNINLGGDRIDTSEAKTSSIQVSREGEKSTLTTQTSKSYPSSAAKKGEQVGGFGVRRSVVVPVHSADASVMNRTLSGKTMEKIRALYPNETDAYFTQIYDALKVDVNNLDVFLEEINENFNKVVQEFDYFARAYQAVTTARNDFRNEMRENMNTKYNLGPDSRFSVIHDMLTPTTRVSMEGNISYAHTGINGFASAITLPRRGESTEMYRARVKAVASQIGAEIRQVVPSMGITNKSFGVPPTELTGKDILRISEILFNFESESGKGGFSKNSNQFLERIKKQRAELFRKNARMKEKTGTGTTQFWAH